jgi:hypothetical protein
MFTETTGEPARTDWREVLVEFFQRAAVRLTFHPGMAACHNSDDAIVNGA